MKGLEIYVSQTTQLSSIGIFKAPIYREWLNMLLRLISMHFIANDFLYIPVATGIESKLEVSSKVYKT
jgi:hypothetical protein